MNLQKKTNKQMQTLTNVYEIMFEKKKKTGKSFPFESDIRVPFLVRGPGVGRGRVVQSLIGNVDLAPTFLDIAGLPVPPHMDGASIFRFFQKEKLKSRAPWRDTYLIERGKLPPSLFPKLNLNQDVPSNNNEGESCALHLNSLCP